MGKHTIVFYALFALILIILVTILFKSHGSKLFEWYWGTLDSAQRKLDATCKIDDSKNIIDSMRLIFQTFKIGINMRSDCQDN